MQQDVQQGKKRKKLKLCNTTEFDSKCEPLHSVVVTADLISPRQENMLTLLPLLSVLLQFTLVGNEDALIYGTPKWVSTPGSSSPVGKLECPGKAAD